MAWTEKREATQASHRSNLLSLYHCCRLSSFLFLNVSRTVQDPNRRGLLSWASALQLHCHRSPQITAIDQIWSLFVEDLHLPLLCLNLEAHPRFFFSQRSVCMCHLWKVGFLMQWICMVAIDLLCSSVFCWKKDWGKFVSNSVIHSVRGLPKPHLVRVWDRSPLPIRLSGRIRFRLFDLCRCIRFSNHAWWRYRSYHFDPVACALLFGALLVSLTFCWVLTYFFVSRTGVIQMIRNRALLIWQYL